MCNFYTRYFEVKIVVNMINTDYLIIGCGLFGSVLAERIANILKKKVIVLEKRNHIGGNCYSEKDSATGTFASLTMVAQEVSIKVEAIIINFFITNLIIFIKRRQSK